MCAICRGEPSLTVVAGLGEAVRGGRSRCERAAIATLLADSSLAHVGCRSIGQVRVKPVTRELLIALGLAVFAAAVSRWTLSGGDQHDEVPVVCTLVIDGCVVAWMLLTLADHHAGPTSHLTKSGRAPSSANRQVRGERGSTSPKARRAFDRVTRSGQRGVHREIKQASATAHPSN
jgi:hypothetical protein